MYLLGSTNGSVISIKCHAASANLLTYDRVIYKEREGVLWDERGVVTKFSFLVTGFSTLGYITFSNIYINTFITQGSGQIKPSKIKQFHTYQCAEIS